jgi:hypothetical protein
MAEHDIPGPDWSKAPPWAQFWAMNSDGHAYWYAAEPTYNAQRDIWEITTDPQYKMAYSASIDWASTLRRRP